MADPDTQATPVVPPPPSEVSIRTLDSDLKSMALSGGDTPVPRNILFTSPSADVEPRHRNWVTPIFILTALLGFGAIGYFIIYPLLFSETQPSELQPPNTPLPPNSSSQGLVPDFEHESFFSLVSDEALTLEVTEAARDVSDLLTLPQRLSGLVSSLPSSISFVEVEFQKKIRKPLAVSDFFTFTKIKFFDSDFILTHFVPDFTFFVFRDGGGQWPGMVLKLKPGQDFFPLRTHISEIERSPDLEVLFLEPPGPRSGAFQDVLLKTQSYRTAPFSLPSAALSYGMVRQYLVIATSQAAFEEALRRL